MRRFLYLFLVIGLAGCGELTGLPTDLQGRYDLYTIDGERLPYYLGYDDRLDADVEIYRAEFEVFGNGRFEEDAYYNLYRSGQQTPSQLYEPYEGTISGSRTRLTVRYSDDTVYEAELSGDALILYSPDGTEFVYLRR